MRPLRWVRRAGLGCLAAGFVISGVPAAAGTLEGFVATARAGGVRMSYEMPGFLVVEKMMDGGGPVAEVTVDALSSGGFASLPYPGDNGVAFGSLLAAGTGYDAPASYPFYVSARNPGSPTAELSDPSGAYRLAAKADPGAATSEARFARPGREMSAGSTSTSSVVNDGATITATAVSHSEGIVLGGGALKLGVVDSRSVTRYTAGDAAPQTTKSIVIEGGSANGTTFSMGPAGIAIGPGSAPVPFGDGLAQLNKGLAPAGIEMAFAQGTEPGSTQAFEVVVTHPVPGVAGDIKGRYRFRFGETATSVTAQGLGAPSVIEKKREDPVTAPPAGGSAETAAPADGSSAAAGIASLPDTASVSIGDVLLAPAREAATTVPEATIAADPSAVALDTPSAPPTALAAPVLRSSPAAARSLLAPVGSAELLGWILAAFGLLAVVASWVLRGKAAGRWTS